MIPRIAQIGAGRFGNNHLKNLIRLDKEKIIKFVGVVDLDDKVRAQIKRQYQLQTSKNINKFLDLTDAFDVVTPPRTHYQLVKLLLKNKKHVFVEKPLSLRFKQAEELVLLSKKNKKILQVGHIFRYHPTINLLKKIVKKRDDIPYYVVASFLQNRIQSHETGAIFVFMHGFDILDILFELKPQKIFAYSNLFTQNPRVEINSVVNLQYKNLNAFINVGWIPTGVKRQIEIFSKKRHIVCDLLKQRIDIYQNEKLKKRYQIKQNEEPLLSELKDFVKCIKKNSIPKSNGIIGARIVKICELAQKSIQKNSVLTF